MAAYTLRVNFKQLAEFTEANAKNPEFALEELEGIKVKSIESINHARI